MKYLICLLCSICASTLIFAQESDLIVIGDRLASSKAIVIGSDGIRNHDFPSQSDFETIINMYHQFLSKASLDWPKSGKYTNRNIAFSIPVARGEDGKAVTEVYIVNWRRVKVDDVVYLRFIFAVSVDRSRVSTPRFLVHEWKEGTDGSWHGEVLYE
jgi:hypothetical protein